MYQQKYIMIMILLSCIQGSWLRLCHHFDEAGIDTNKTCEPSFKACWNSYRIKNNTYKLWNADCHNYNEGCTENVCNIQLYKGGFTCCCTGNLCNKNVVHPKILMTSTTEKPEVPINSTTAVTKITKKKPKKTSTTQLVLIILPIIFFSLIFIVIIAALFYKRRKKVKHNLLLRENQALTSAPKISVEMYEQISRGQFGCVWKGLYDGNDVAIKIVLPQAYNSWEIEKTMYSDYALQHENVVKFYSAEKRYEYHSTQYWIVTEFQQNGSLADYLPKVTFKFDELMRVLISLISGLAYLHTEDLEREPAKPSIAHRDFKSRNVLVKSDGTCCLSDFGSSYAFPEGYEKDENMAQCGTNRYMSPEVLQGAVAFKPESFLGIDIYALALVLWECLTRYNDSEEELESYRSPYEDVVGIHPSIEDMKDWVVDKQYRPKFKDQWKQDEKLSYICDTIEECWDEESDARLTAACVYARLKMLISEQKDKEESSIFDASIDDNENETTRLFSDTTQESSIEVIDHRPPEYSNLTQDSITIVEDSV